MVPVLAKRELHIIIIFSSNYEKKKIENKLSCKDPLTEQIKLWKLSKWTYWLSEALPTSSNTKGWKMNILSGGKEKKEKKTKRCLHRKDGNPIPKIIYHTYNEMNISRG